MIGKDPSWQEVYGQPPARAGVDTRAARRCLAELIAWQAVGWPCTALVLSAALFWAGVPIGPYHAWASLVLFLVIGGVLAKDARAWGLAAACLAACTVIGGALLGWLYDFTGDGQWYHLPGVLALAQGWNPFHTPRISDWNPAFAQDLAAADVNYPSYVYVQHYAKAAWIIAAAAYQATGFLEAAKLFNLLYALAAYSLALALLRRLGIARGLSQIFAITAAASPVVLYQLGTFFVDGQLASLYTVALLSSVDYFRKPRSQPLLLLGACVMLLADLKFTGLVFAAALIAGVALLAWLVHRRASVARYAAVGAASLLVGALVVGYQPYVTNLVDKGHPFYPALGREDARNVQWHSAPADFMSLNPAEKLVRSLFAASAGGDEMPQWKLPFTVSKQELYIFFNAEPRYGGFGPFFGPLLLLSLVSFALAWPVMPSQVRSVGAGLAIVVAATALLNPEAWWARLSPQLWLVPVVLLCAVAAGASGWRRGSAVILALLLLGNSALVGALNLGRAVEKNLLFREQLAALKAMSARGPVEIAVHRSFRLVTEIRLTARGIPYTLTKASSCATPFRFSYPADAQASACPAQSTDARGRP